MWLAEAGQPSARIPWEYVVHQNPEILILMPCGFDVARTVEDVQGNRKLPGWANVAAVSDQRVYAVAANAFFSRPGPRLVDGIELMAKILHPGLFRDGIDPLTARNVVTGS